MFQLDTPDDLVPYLKHELFQKKDQGFVEHHLAVPALFWTFSGWSHLCLDFAGSLGTIVCQIHLLVISRVNMDRSGPFSLCRKLRQARLVWPAIPAVSKTGPDQAVDCLCFQQTQTSYRTDDP